MTQASTTSYYCPMHGDVRQTRPGTCTKCGMALVPEGARFALLHHMLANPLHLVMMAVVMVVIMAVAMMLTR